jgi:hypothetical protein
MPSKGIFSNCRRNKKLPWKTKTKVTHNIKPSLKKILKESCTEKRKINTTMKIWKRINLSRWAYKQMRSKEELNTTKPINGRKYFSIITLILMVSILKWKTRPNYLLPKRNTSHWQRQIGLEWKNVKRFFKLIYFLLLCWVKIYCGIYRCSYSISYLNSPSSPFFFIHPHSWNSFNRYHFSFYIHVYTVFVLYSPSHALSSLSFPLPLVRMEKDFP